MLRKARLFRSLNFPCAATASTCEDSPCFQVFGVNLFHVIANSSQRFVSRFEACMLIFTHSCVLSVVVVVSTIMVIIVLSFFITVVMISETVSLNDVMSKCIFDLFLLPEVMGWEVGLIEVIACIYFIGPCLIFLLHFLNLCFQFKFLIDLSGSWYKAMLWTTPCTWSPWVHSWGSNATTFLYVWQMNAWYSLVILSWASQPLSKYYYCINVLILIRHCCIYIIFALWRHSRETAILYTDDGGFAVYGGRYW